MAEVAFKSVISDLATLNLQTKKLQDKFAEQSKRIQEKDEAADDVLKDVLSHGCYLAMHLEQALVSMPSGIDHKHMPKTFSSQVGDVVVSWNVGEEMASAV